MLLMLPTKLITSGIIACLFLTLGSGSHISAFRGICGDGCVGLGADYDGVEIVPVGLENVSKYPNLISELVQRGYTSDQISKLTNGNIMRVMQQAEQVSAALQGEAPYESTIYPDSTFLQKTCRSKF